MRDRVRKREDAKPSRPSLRQREEQERQVFAEEDEEEDDGEGEQEDDGEEDVPEIVFRCSNRGNLAHAVMSKRPGWVETDDDVDWDINWADVAWTRDMYDQIQMDDDQRLNHFPNHYELTRKDLMVKNLKRMRKQLQRNDCAAEAACYSF